MRKSALLALSLFLAAAAVAQEPQKPKSPPQQVQYTTNGKKITIDYSAPSKRGRTIFGELVPYDKVWRTGANAATTLTTDTDLMIGSLHVPAGKYTLYTIPGPKEWTLIVNKQTGQWGTKYDEKQDLGRVKMKVASPLETPVETFAIGIDKTLSFTWDTTKAWVPVVVH
ncbi:MAG TPA: DUF2911 domain-containing protein [Thermoanaerobaculia bacterium]|nr:DUF2911 domain-containing protein [Thermoanaerobaculia bacterium]